MDEETPKWHPAVLPVVVGIVSFGLGVVVGRYLRRSAKTISKASQEELDKISASLAEMRAEREAKAIAEVVAMEEAEELPQPVEIDETTDSVKGFISSKAPERIKPTPPTEADVVRQSIFAKNDSDWDYQAELKSRDSTAPYVIHKDEFWSNEMGFHQSTLTYYDGDDILADEEDTPVYNHDGVVGPLKFGHGSGDEKVVYIRNEARRAEYEVIKDQGLFSEQVLGLHIEDNDRVKERDLKHATANKKFRPE